MEDVNERKTPEKIKEKILDALNNKPLNAQEISKAINSNWSTVKIYIRELVNGGKVKEIAFGEKNLIYQKITGDTYFNIPITEAQRNMFRFIFYNAIKQYKETIRKPIRRVDLAKLTDYVNYRLKLNLPIVWYLHGPMPLMIIDLERDYSIGYHLKNAEEIKDCIKTWIKEKSRERVKEVIRECYSNSNEKLHQIKLELFERLEQNNTRDIYALTRNFYLTYLTYYNDDLSIVERFYEAVSGLDYLNFLKNPAIKNRVLLAFDAIWKYVASKALFKSMLNLRYDKETAELYLTPVIETKKYLAEESLKELEEKYTEALPENLPERKPTNVDKKIAEVMGEWLESETWRE